MKIDHGIDEEGLIEDAYMDIETRYCPMESIGISWNNDAPEEAYLRITGDDGMTNVEIRVPGSVLELNGFTWNRVLPPSEDTN